MTPTQRAAAIYVARHLEDAAHCPDLCLSGKNKKTALMLADVLRRSLDDAGFDPTRVCHDLSDFEYLEATAE
jgi:hypothetical protein